MHIGFSEWEVRTEIPVPCDYEFSDYVNEKTSCKISVDNFIEFKKQWKMLKRTLPDFAIIYRDDSDVINCKGFNSKSEMNLFINNYSQDEFS